MQNIFRANIANSLLNSFYETESTDCNFMHEYKLKPVVLCE